MVARQTVVLQSRVQIRRLPSQQLSANLLVGCHLGWHMAAGWPLWGATEEKITKKEPLVHQKHTKKKKVCCVKFMVNMDRIRAWTPQIQAKILKRIEAKRSIYLLRFPWYFQANQVGNYLQNVIQPCECSETTLTGESWVHIKRGSSLGIWILNLGPLWREAYR